MRGILVCYDGSLAGRGTIAAATELLLSRSVVVLNVAPLETVGEAYVPVGDDRPAAHDGLAADALDYAAEGAELARAAGVDARAHADLDAPTWAGVLEVADEIDAPVIILESRAWAGVRALLEGNAAQELTKRAERPVLVIPGPTGTRGA